MQTGFDRGQGEMLRNRYFFIAFIFKEVEGENAGKIGRDAEEDGADKGYPLGTRIFRSETGCIQIGKIHIRYLRLSARFFL